MTKRRPFGTLSVAQTAAGRAVGLIRHDRLSWGNDRQAAAILFCAGGSIFRARNRSALPEYDPRREPILMTLTVQLLLLLIGAGGSVVTALTLPDSRCKWFCVTAFGVAGLAGFVLMIITYEQTPSVPHFSDEWLRLHPFF